MSLRVRLIALTVLVLVASLVLGGVLAVWHAAQSVRTELAASLEVGGQGLRNAVEDLADVPDPADDAARLVATFNGNRHVRALLVDRIGAAVASSRPLRPADPVPTWFLWAVGPQLSPVRVSLPVAAHGGAIVLQPFPENEASEVWAQYGDSGVTLGVFCLLMSGLILAVVGRGLQPLDDLTAAFRRIGAGDYAARVHPWGSPELVRLAAGFNAMAERLDTMQSQNRRLHEQLMTLQDEERADLARDLHDEIGPFLFSVNVTAATIGQLVTAGRVDELPQQLRDIGEAVGHMQTHVQSILARLRPVRAVEFGLVAAVTDMVAFWRGRHAAISFCAKVDPGADEADEAAQEVAYRVVQESLSNAMRHSQPSRIEIAVDMTDHEMLIRVADDGAAIGGTEAQVGGGTGAGFGLTGMRERVAALGGALRAGRDAPDLGWRVEARIPVNTAAATLAPARLAS